ncbi:MAG: hypothetical protein J6M23_08880 [Bacteroidales bacterium]|nr:hypothetical protein [Bacteroidales bacterium]
MHDYIFYTEEGLCQAPDNSAVENFQVLGFERGNNPAEAIDRLIVNNPWIIEKGYTQERILHKEVVY